MGDADFDFSAAWKEYETAQGKAQPRTATNVLDRIEREAVAAHRWPDAVKAFVRRVDTERGFSDEFKEDWIPLLESRIGKSSPAVRPYLDLYLAHVYAQNSAEWRWGGERPTKLTDDAAEAKLPAWSPERLPDSLEALFARVLAAAPRLKAEPVSEWNGVLASASMPDSCRPTLYDLAVHDILGFYGENVPDKTLEKGLALIDSLIEFHRGDADIDALADARLARIAYEHSFAELPPKENNSRYDAALDAFVAEYLDRTEVGALAAYYRALMLQESGELVKARELALKGCARWPKSAGGTNCRALADRIAQPNVSFLAERVWSAPFAPITVSAKCVDKAVFKLVRISSEDFRCRDRQKTDEIRKRAVGAEPVKTWSVDLAHFDDYRTHEQTVAVPEDLAPGCYYLFAGSDDWFLSGGGVPFGEKGLPYYAEKIQVSDIALALSCGDGRFGGTVFRSAEGSRVEGARVELYGSIRYGKDVKLLATALTDADGEFSIPNGEGWTRCWVRAAYRESEVTYGGELWVGARNSETFVPERLSVVTDRAIYRPGQPIKFKGYAAYVDPYKRDFRVLPGARVEVELFDPNGKRVAGFALTANEWGSFIGEFTAPRDRMSGPYSIHSHLIHGRVTSVAQVSVEEYKRPKFSVELGSAPVDAALGREIELVGTAKTYSGLPVAGAKVEWSVDRSTRYPGWWCWFGCDDDDDDGDDQVADGEATTDENGEFRIRFTPVASRTADLSGEPSFVFSVNADVTDTAGETRSADASCEIGTVAWRAEAYAPEGQFAGEPFKASVSLRSLDGTAASAKGVLTVRRLKGPATPVRVPLSRGYWDRDRQNGPWDWRSWEGGEAVKTLAVEVKDGEWKGMLELPEGAYRLVFETQDPAGKKVTGRGEVAVIDRKAEKLGFAVPDYFVLKRPEGKVTVGSTISYLWASGYAQGYGRVELHSNGKLVSRTDTDFAKPFVFGEYTIKEEDRGQVEVRTVFFREGRLYTHRDVVNVVWDNMDLTVEKEHFTSKLTAGVKETWKFKASGPGEVLALMYDRSLDAYQSHFVAFPFRDFSVPERWIGELQLFNGLESLDLADGRLPSVRAGHSIAWRGLDAIFSSFAAGRIALAGGNGLYSREACPRANKPMMERMECAAVADECVAVDGCAMCAAAPRKSVPNGGAGESEVAVRKNLEETAFFLPQLETDADGRFTVSFTAPEAMSGWNFTAVVHDKQLRSGVLRDDTVTTTRPLMVEPNAPRFVREGDDFRFAVKVTNNSDEPETAVVSLAFENLASLTPAAVGGGETKVGLKPHETRSVEFPVAIPDGQGFLKYTAKAVGATFADGEEGALAVLSRRIEVREAVQLNVRGKDTKAFALTNLVDAVKNGDTIRSVDLTVRVVSRPAWYAVASLPYLIEYPHECCEQTFHRYYANRLAAYVAGSDPRIKAVFEKWRNGAADALRSPLELNENLKAIALEMTPWVREAAGETEAKKRMGVLFDDGRIAAESERALAKLEDAITDEDLLPWFPGGPGSASISLNVLVGSLRLEKLAGVARPPDWFDRVRDGVDRFEQEDVRERLDRCKKHKIDFHVNDFDVRWLYLHSFAKVAAGDKATTELLMKCLREQWTDFSIGSQALAAVALHRGGAAAEAGEIMKSLRERAVVSEEFGMYYKFGTFFSSSVFAAPVSMQTVVVEAFKEVAGDQAVVDALNVWILKQRETQAWATTVSTADAIYALLIGGGTDLLADGALATVTLGGVEVPKRDVEEGTGAYAASWRGAEVKPEMGAITLKGAQDHGVVWGGVNWTYLEDVDKVRAFEPKEIRIDKQYFRKIRTPQGTRLEPVKGVLEQGDELVARLRIRSDRTLEFVHIRDERPSTAEPVDVLSQYRWQDGVGYYQSTRDTATHYYIDRLNKGEFVLETSYRVQQRGVFSGGLAQIQCMYAPEFAAHSTSERIEVK